MSRTVADGLSDVRGCLAAAGVDAPAGEARRIMAAAMNMAPDRISLLQTAPLSCAAEDRLARFVARRCAREPLAHILGLRAFYGHEFRITRDVLDPRPETETLVRAALAVPFETVLDLGVGSGCILLSLLAERGAATGLGTDVSEAALRVAQANAVALGVARRTRFQTSDWFERVRGRFDLIIANPPYIAVAEMPALAPELTFEPRQALTDEGDGLSAYRVITSRVCAFLNPGGWLMVETGWTQGPTVAAMMRRAGLDRVRSVPDLDGRDRVVQGRHPSGNS